MNIQHYWNFFLKRTLRKKSVWVVIAIHLFVFLLRFFLSSYLSLSVPSNSVQNVNDFLGRSFWFQQILLTNWVYILSPLSWILWWRFDDIGKETQTDGTDLFLLSTGIPTNRKKIFLGKIFFLASFLISFHLIFVILPEMILVWKQGAFSNITGINTLLLVVVNSLLASLLFFLPLFIFLFSLASLKSIWYTILKWTGNLIPLFVPIMLLVISSGGEKTITWTKKILELLDNNYLWITLTIIGTTILLSLIALHLAYKDFQEKDLN